MSRYRVKEVFYTLQGEGHQAGRPATFCRFSRCNLWSGKEAHRSRAICQFCDTDFVGTNGSGGGIFASASDLARHIVNHWPNSGAAPYIVLTGGEPMLQVDANLIAALHELGCEVAIETNGTLYVEESIDWVCVSPKAGAPLKQRSGSELKVVFPQEGLDLEELATLSFSHFYLQPMDGPNREQATAKAVEYCLAHPRWRLSLQTHKYLGIR